MIHRKIKRSLEASEANWNVKHVCVCVRALACVRECVHACVCRGKRRKTWVGAGSVSCHLSLETYSPAPPPASPAPVCGTALVCSRLRQRQRQHTVSALIWLSPCSASEILSHACFFLNDVSQVFWERFLPSQIVISQFCTAAEVKFGFSLIWMS